MSVTPRERYLGICRFQWPGDLYYSDSFAWSQTLREWVNQGAPREIKDPAFRAKYFQYGSGLRWLVEIRSGLEFNRGRVYDLGHGVRSADWGTAPAVPGYQPTIVAEDERTLTIINGGGQTVRAFKGSASGKMPTFMDWPVKDRQTWNEFKKRLDPETPERWPPDWKAYVEYIKGLSQQYAMSLQVGSFFGYLREWTGEMRFLYMFYDDPVLVEDMMEQMLYLETEVVKRVVKDIKIDQATYWEDMAYKAGPLISPDMVRRFMMPRYKQLNDLLHRHGVDIIWLDCDGNIEKLIPLWLESGINYVWPLEVAAGNDAVALRKKYGKQLILGGNIDKRALIKGKEAIREEVRSKVPFLLEQGGYFPSVDHNVPPDVTFDNYCYYINTLREAGGLPPLSFT